MKKVFFLSYIFLSLLLCNSKTFGQWQLTGNSNAIATSVLGTTNAIPLNLTTNNVQRLVIDANGKIGIGTATPINILTVKGAGSTPAASWVTAGAPLFVGFGETAVGNADYILAMASTSTNGRPVFVGRRSRGTLAAPTAMINNDFILSMLASAHDGTAFQNPASIDFLVDGVVSAGNVPARISFVTGSNSTNRAERLKVGSAGDITFNTNQLFLQQSTGFLGIGTTSPNAQLQLANTVVNRKLVLADFANNDHQFYGFGVNSNTLRYQVDATTANHVFYAGTGNSTSNELMRIQGNGNVGIGTAAPFANFVVNSGGNTAKDRGLWTAQYSSDNNGAIVGGRKAYGTETNPQAVANGSYGTALVSEHYDGFNYQLNGSIGYRITGNVSANNVPGEWYFGASNTEDVNPYANNSVRMVVQSTGKVGIGTIAPAAKLDVAGNVKIADGTQGAGKVLTSDANGLASWQVPSGSSGQWTATGNNLYNSNSGNIGIGTTIPTSKLNVNGQITIDQKNFGGHGGLLIKGNVPGNNYPNISFSVKNAAATPVDVVAGEITGVLTNATVGSEAMDLSFSTSQTGVGGLATRLYIKDNGNVGIGTTTPPARFAVADSNVVFTGPASLPASSTYGPPVSGAGTRMMWYPQKGAFRAGVVDNTQWNKDSIGRFSFAANLNTKAKGEASTAFGYSTIANGFNSTAIGNQTTANGNNAAAMGETTSANGQSSLTSGAFTFANGRFTTSLGYSTTANGETALCSGNYTKANGYASLVTGSFNDTIVASQNSMQPTTPLFIVGNGSSPTVRSNAMVVRYDGNVGIGTNTPNQKLDVAGTIQAANTVIVDNAQTNNGLVTENSLRFGGSVSGEAIASKRTATSNQFGIDFYTNSINRLAITNGGNVGIGTTTPSNKLSVIGDANVDGVILARNSANTLAYGKIQHTGNSGNFHLDTYGTGGIYLNYFSGTGTYIGNGAGGIVASFLQNGNMGIGTTPSTYKLEVCGTIRAKEVRVETGWCDYVFANDYKLRSLADVESFIKENKHLPDVTSGAEIESNGLEVGKTSAQMIKKIEELTLYVIEMQKQIDELKKSNK